jgi:serine protease AprX
MRVSRRTAGLAAATLVLATGASALTAAPSSALTAAPVQAWLQDRLATAGPTEVLRVYVHADTAAHARQAATAAGLGVQEVFDQVGIAVAVGTPASVRAARLQPFVSYVEGDRPVTPLLATSNTATRGAEAVATLDGADGSDLDGSGVSIAIIDSGVDGTHPFFREADGSSKVVRNLKSACLFISFTATDTCFVDVVGNDSDTLSTGGHGTHVAGIAAGVPTVVAGKKIQGAAPGAKLIGLSVGQAVSVYGGDTGLNWVLDHHADPCGDGSCPPIKVTNNSYGVQGGSDFDPRSATVKLQRALAAQGVVTAWAAGNDGGDGSGRSQTTNGPGMDPTGGILMVASYDDGGTGTRNGVVSDFSSRGVKGQLQTYPDISAPGTDIQSACRAYLPICSTGFAFTNAGDYNTISGTSMATPHIAGIVAQLFEKNPAATPAAIERALVDGAHGFTHGAPYEADPRGGLTSFDKGHGLVDVVRSAGLV